MQPLEPKHPSIALPTLGNDQLGRYRLVVRLATGGMAEIFLARQTGAQGFEKLVVVKRILPAFSADPDFVAMFLDEGRLAGQLNHPSIVQTFDLGEDDGTYFIAMEYVVGESLSMLARTSRLKALPIDDRFSARIIAQAAAGLDHAHHRTDILGNPLNIVHRDVSPQNLLVSVDGQVKVVDFGIAKAASRATHTQKDQVKGKVSYMSPEQLTGAHPIDGRADLFSLGVVMFELVTGSRWADSGDPARAVGILTGHAPRPSAIQRRPDLDPRLNRIINRAVELVPEARYQRGMELHDELEAWLATQPTLGQQEMALFVQDIFKERLAERKEIIDRALRGELRGEPPISTADAKSDSMPGGHLVTDAAIPKPLDRRIIGVSAAVMAIGLYAAAWTRLGHRTATPSLEPGVPPAATAAPGPATAPVPPAPIPVPTPTAVEAPPLAAAPQPVPAAAPPQAPQSAAPLSGSAPPTSPAKATSSAAPAPVPTPTPPPCPTPPHRRSHPKPAAAAAPAVEGTGHLSIDTTPWTEVFWHGKSLGQTPLLGVELGAGPQHLVLMNPDENIEQGLDVQIRPNETVTKRLRLR